MDPGLISNPSKKKDSKNVQSLISVLSSYRLRTSKVLRGEIGCKRNLLGRDCGTSVCSRQSTKIQRYKDAKNTKTRKYENTRLVVGRSQLGRQCGTSAVPRQLVPSPDSPGRHNPKVDLFDFVQIETQLQKAKCIKIQIQESLLSKPPSPTHLPTQKLTFPNSEASINLASLGKFLEDGESEQKMFDFFKALL